MDLYIWYAVIVIALVTALLRFLPFLIFNEKRKTPKFIERLSKLLPAAIMGMLVVYCLRGINFENTANYLPALISSLVVVILHAWKRNTLISIISGTLCYMIFVQVIF